MCHEDPAFLSHGVTACFMEMVRATKQHTVKSFWRWAGQFSQETLERIMVVAFAGQRPEEVVAEIKAYSWGGISEICLGLRDYGILVACLDGRQLKTGCKFESAVELYEVFAPKETRAVVCVVSVVDPKDGKPKHWDLAVVGPPERRTPLLPWGAHKALLRGIFESLVVAAELGRGNYSRLWQPPETQSIFFE